MPLLHFGRVPVLLNYLLLVLLSAQLFAWACCSAAWMPCAQFVVGLGDKVAPTDIEEGMRVGYARTLAALCTAGRYACGMTAGLWHAPAPGMHASLPPACSCSVRPLQLADCFPFFLGPAVLMRGA